MRKIYYKPFIKCPYKMRFDINYYMADVGYGYCLGWCEYIHKDYPFEHYVLCKYSNFSDKLKVVKGLIK